MLLLAMHLAKEVQGARVVGLLMGVREVEGHHAPCISGQGAIIHPGLGLLLLVYSCASLACTAGQAC